MNDGNVWNQDYQNGNSRYDRNRPSGNSYHKNQKSHNRPNRSSGNQQGSSRENNPVQVKLLEELVQQNHTIIGLLRGIKHALSDGEHAPKDIKKNAVKKTERDHSKSVKKEKVKNTPEPADTNKMSSPKPMRQFVMRFDNKEPLNKDLDETISVAEKTVEFSTEVVQAIDLVNDENSVGEGDPFEFFGSLDEE